MKTKLRQFIDDFKNEKHLWNASRESYEYSLSSIVENYIDTYAEIEEREYSELVERATPMKAILRPFSVEYDCPICKHNVGWMFSKPHFCSNCSQALDWSDGK